MSEYEWWAAPSLEEAVADYKNETGEDPDTEELHELTDAEMDSHVMMETDENETPTGRRPTFREYLAENPITGFFAGTDW